MISLQAAAVIQERDDGCPHVFRANVAEIIALNDPLSGWEWDCNPIPRTDVLRAIAEGRLEGRSWQQVNEKWARMDWEKFHTERVAYLTVNRDRTPIKIETEVWEKRLRLRIYDGNHRLAAASIRGDQEVEFTVSFGEVSDIRTLLPSMRLSAAADDHQSLHQ